MSHVIRKGDRFVACESSGHGVRQWETGYNVRAGEENRRGCAAGQRVAATQQPLPQDGRTVQPGHRETLVNPRSLRGE